jgi:hypothetical protein
MRLNFPRIDLRYAVGCYPSSPRRERKPFARVEVVTTRQVLLDRVTLELAELDLNLRPRQGTNSTFVSEEPSLPKRIRVTPVGA